MADETTEVNASETEGTTTVEQTGERTFSQEEVNRIVGKARIEVRGQFADYDALKAKVEQMGDYDAIKTELEALKAEKAKAEEERKAAAERAEAVAKAAQAHGVDAALLARMSGDVEANAQYLASRPKFAPVHDDGGVAGARSNVVTRESIEAIKDPVKRVRMRAQHQDLYR